MKKLKLAEVVHPADLNWESDWVTWEDLKDVDFKVNDAYSKLLLSNAVKIGIGVISDQVYLIVRCGEKNWGDMFRVVIFGSEGDYFMETPSKSDLYELRDFCNERERAIEREEKD